MDRYNGYPIAIGRTTSKSNLIVDKCPYCGQTHHHNYTKYTISPTRRMSHCLRIETCDYYYIRIPELEGGEKKDEQSNVQIRRCTKNAV